jgi:hypothetical protein
LPRPSSSKTDRSSNGLGNPRRESGGDYHFWANEQLS